MFGFKRFETGDSSWGGSTDTCQIFRDELQKDLRGLDLQLQVDALNGDTWAVSVLTEGSEEIRLYNDNGGAGFGAASIVMIDVIAVIGVKIVLTGGGAVAPAVVVNWRRRGI